MSEQRSIRRSLGTRWLGVGLASLLSVTTLVLGLTGRLTLYIAPETVWFACAAAVVTVLGALWSCTLPLGDEEEHHDHDHEHEPGAWAQAGSVIAGAVASLFVIAALVLPPASLSVELAMSRATESGALFAGSDNVVLGDGDTSFYGVGDWATVFASSTRPEKYDGTAVTLTGFITPSAGNPDEVRLTRMVITHCVIDAQPAHVPVAIVGWAGAHEVGDWVEITGTVRAHPDGSLWVQPDAVVPTPEPGDPYEY